MSVRCSDRMDKTIKILTKSQTHAPLPTCKLFSGSKKKSSFTFLQQKLPPTSQNIIITYILCCNRNDGEKCAFFSRKIKNILYPGLIIFDDKRR